LQETIRHGEQLQRNCEKQFAMANSSKQNCKRQFATANSPKQNCMRQFAMANSHYKNWNDNSPRRTAITKNGTAIRHGEQPLQKLEQQFATANSHYKKSPKGAVLHSPGFQPWVSMDGITNKGNAAHARFTRQPGGRCRL